MNRLLLLFVLALGLSACATPTDVNDTQAPSSGPTLYGQLRARWNVFGDPEGQRGALVPPGHLTHPVLSGSSPRIA